MANTKKCFRVLVESITTYELLINAKDKEEAQELAEQVDGSEFSECGIGTWDIVDADEAGDEQDGEDFEDLMKL